MLTIIGWMNPLILAKLFEMPVIVPAKAGAISTGVTENLDNIIINI